ncbi:MAG: glycosyltransferase family 4 protein [Flavobacterium sp.]|uniref:glycosyltransferase family 4 protein n=1 Tax=Flavobacterium sp. TaxID=239 RepID=UPI00260F6686|nr:glycosyltransferase family 4 protein [Flavobacterium sp.]MDD5151694.1 glycosyltransferase family 4 protein [Flavobacterium sp.]
MIKRKILFLGETYRADAITWMNGLKEFGDFEIITWELKTPNATFFSRILRILEFCTGLFQVKKIIKKHHPDIVIAERTTSYGFLAALSGIKPIVVAQQGRTDLWPEKSLLLPIKKIIQNYAFEKANLIHAWGPVMTISMKAINVDMSKVLVMPKGIDLVKYANKNTANPSKINAIVTRSLMPEYCHDIILKAFSILNQEGIDFELTIVGDGKLLPKLKELATRMKIEKKIKFTGQIPNTDLPELLQKSNFYISMPTTEGVSTSLFEAMASNCYPIVTNIPGNQSWITHRENGQLIPIDNFRMLADEILWAFENSDYRNTAVVKNRKFIEENADYNTNMKIIAAKYHQLINTYKTN